MDDSTSSGNTSSSVAASLAADPEQRIPPVAVSETCDSPEPVTGGTLNKPATGFHNNALSEIEEVMRNGPSAVQKGKQAAMASDVSRKRPLRLLDLPVDILKEIIKEVRILEFIVSTLSLRLSS